MDGRRGVVGKEGWNGTSRPRGEHGLESGLR